MRKRQHSLTVATEGREIDGWKSVTIESDILTPADAFTLTRGYDPRVFRLLRRDTDIEILIDGKPMMRGFVERRRGDWRGFTISGKDRIGRLVAESAPLHLDYAGRDLVAVASELAAPWFEKVKLSNAENRAVMRGRRQRAASEPLLNPRTDARQPLPGTKKWEALKELLDRAGYHAWSSADGRDLILARPDFAQEPSHHFYVGVDGSNCRSITYDENNADHYAAIVAMDSGRVGSSYDGLGPDGAGEDFQFPKRLLLPVEADDVAECQRIAERERAARAARAFVVEIQAWAWGQVVPPASGPTLFTHDMVVSACSINTPVDGSYYVVSRSFSLARNEESTRLRCVNLGVQL